MRELWELTPKFCRNDDVEAVFLAVNIVCWTAGTLLAGLVFCLITGTAVSLCLTKLMCAAIYMGLIVGLAGGIVYLFRRRAQ